MLRKIIIFTFCYVLIGTNFSVAAEKIGVIGAANKNITSVNSDGKQRNLNIGDDVFFKETIKSDSTGNGQLMFLDKSALTVGPNSSVVIDEFVYNPESSSGNLIMRGTKGTFRFIGGALSKKNAVKIKTPVGTIGIRGGIAIVDIDPMSGATNATFVYGDVLTFENLAGDMQSINDRGAGLAVKTPNDMPQFFRATTEQIANQVQSLSGRPGTSGGAKVIPTDALVGKKIRLIFNDDTSSESENSEGAVETEEGEGESKEGEGEQGDKKDSKDEKASKENKNEKGKTATERTADNKDNSTAKKPAADGDKTAGSTVRKPTGTISNDSSYVTKEGTYNDPAKIGTYDNRDGQTDSTASSGYYYDPYYGGTEGGKYYGDGYGGGYYSDGYYDNGNYNYNRYWQQGFSFTKNVNNQINGASLNLSRISGTGPTNAYATFGTTNGIHSYIDDSTYALEQVNMPYGGTGVMVSGNLVSNLGCNECKYVPWGVWASETNVSGASNKVDIAHMMPYIAGTITNNVNLPNLVSATYSGPVFGNILNGSGLSAHQGAMNATIQLGNGSAATINSSDLNITGFGGYSFYNTNPIAFNTKGKVKFDNAPLSGNINAGSINGALFGPSGQNFGGNFKFDASGGVQGTGVYLVNQTSTTP